MTVNSRKTDARTKLLDAALGLIRQKGYAATSVDDLCRAAGVTKGAFFHHFRSKDDLAVAAARYWGEMTGAMFAQADYHRLADPVARILGYVALRRQLLAGEVAEFTCLAGTMVQEAFDSSPGIRAACADAILGHAATLEADIAAAMESRGLEAQEWSPSSLALHIQAVLQGAFILAKATGGAAAAAACVDHLDRYIRLLFGEDAGQSPV